MDQRILSHFASLLFVTISVCVHFRNIKLVSTERNPTQETNSTADLYLNFNHQREPDFGFDFSDKLSPHLGRSILQKSDPTDVCAAIKFIGQKKQTNTDQKRESPCKVLKVWVPKKKGFTEFVDVVGVKECSGTKTFQVKDGFSIAVFCAALRQLPYKVQPVFQPFVTEKGESKGTYDHLLNQVKGKPCEAVAGDVTILFYRTSFVDFTAPYISSEVVMVVPAVHKMHKSLWGLLRPFSLELWLTIISASIFVGLAIGFLEWRIRNNEYAGSLYQQLIMVGWFPIWVLFYREGRIANNWSKVVLVVWLGTAFIVMQIFTACLSSTLTIDQLTPKLPPKTPPCVGYQNDSFVEHYLTEQLHFNESQLKPYSTAKEYKTALNKGCANGGVDAIYDELPYIKLFLAKYGSEFMMVGQKSPTTGIAFAFPSASLIQAEFSKAVINVTESPDMMTMRKVYLKYTSPDQEPSQILPQRLGVHSLGVLFIIMAIVTLGSVLFSEHYLWRRRTQVLPCSTTAMNTVVDQPAAQMTYLNRDLAPTVDIQEHLIGENISISEMEEKENGKEMEEVDSSKQGVHPHTTS